MKSRQKRLNDALDKIRAGNDELEALGDEYDALLSDCDDDVKATDLDYVVDLLIYTSESIGWHLEDIERLAL